MNNKTIPLILVLFLALGWVTGCSSQDETYKLELQEAILKQSEIQQYRFEGNLHLQMNRSSNLSGDHPLTATLISMLANSKMEWRGVVDIDQAHMEADIWITPMSSETTYPLSVIIKDNKMYFNMPLLTIDEEEYLTIDLDKDVTQAQGFVTDSVLTHLIEGMEPVWFKKGKQTEKQLKTIMIEITKDNMTEMMSFIASKLPQITDDLVNRDLLHSQQAEQLHNMVEQWNGRAEQPAIDQPSSISFTINQDGYIVSQELKWYIDGQSIELFHHVKDLNQNPSFSKQLPENTRSINEVFQ